MQTKVKKKLEKINAQYKAVADKHRHFKVFEKGDSVMVSLQNREHSLKNLARG